MRLILFQVKWDPNALRGLMFFLKLILRPNSNVMMILMISERSLRVQSQCSSTGEPTDRPSISWMMMELKPRATASVSRASTDLHWPVEQRFMFWPWCVSDRVFSAEETTAQLYQDIAKPLVVSAVEGYNGESRNQSNYNLFWQVFESHAGVIYMLQYIQKNTENIACVYVVYIWTQYT